MTERTQNIQREVTADMLNLSIELYAIDNLGKCPIGTYEGEDLFNQFLQEYMEEYDISGTRKVRYKDVNGVMRLTEDIIYYMHTNYKGFIAVPDGSVEYSSSQNGLDIADPDSSNGRLILSKHGLIHSL